MSVARVRHFLEVGLYAKQIDGMTPIIATAMCEALLRGVFTEAVVAARLEGKSHITADHIASGIASNAELSGFIPGTVFASKAPKKRKAAAAKKDEAEAPPPSAVTAQ